MSRIPLRTRAFASTLPYAVLALAACSSHERPQTVLAERCTSISAAHPVQFAVSPPSPGLLRIAVEQRGISVIATLAATSGAKQGQMSSATSPSERFGVVTLAPELRTDQPVTVTVRSRDSPDITGDVCVSAERPDPADSRRLRAERAYAAAGLAVQAEDPQRAFDSYLVAAREFDHVDRRRAAQSRHAMAEIAYLNLRDDEGAYVLATWARADFGAAADAGLRSELIALQAQTLLESQRFEPDVRRARVFELLRASQALAQHSKFGVRELPRFDILRGFMEYRTGNSSEAAAFFMQAARQCEALRDWECAAGARQNIANLAEEARDYTVALQAYSDALRALPPDLTPKLSADIWGNYGRLQGRAGLLRQSERSHRTAIRLYTGIADCDGTRMSVARLGTLLVQVGSIGEGYSYLSRAASLECPALLTSAKRESTADSTRSRDSAPGEAVASDRGESNAPADAACINLPTAESLTEAGKLAVFNALLGLRDASTLQNDEVQARGCLAAAHAYASTARTRLRLANAEGATLLDRGNPVRASTAFQRGLAIADQARLSQTHENRSLAYIGLARAALLENRPSEARRYAARALVLGSARADVGQIVDSLQLMARGFSADKASDPAISILRTAAGLIEQVPIDDLDAEQRATWLATQHAVFAELTTLFAAGAGNDEARAWEAFQVSERGRARSLRYAMNQATDTRSTSSSEPASAHYHELMQQIAQLAPPAQSGRTQEVSLEALGKLAEQSKVAPESSIPAALRQQLAALDATVVEYAAGRDSMFAFVIDSDHIRVVPLASLRDIAAAAATLYERLRNPETASSDVRHAAQRVAELALWPLAEHVVHRRVIFIPDDALHTVPFAVLPWTSAADSPLVVERAELSVVPTTLFVTRAREGRSLHERAPRLELIGDPIFRAADWERECQGNANGTPAPLATLERERVSSRGGRSLPQLPGSGQEVTAIAELARRSTPASDIHMRLRCKATPTALREAAAASPELLHIATHGYVDAYRPRLSALALTPDAVSNGAVATIGLLDILNTPIRSRLVVLSACDTSRGRLLPGEGVLGPAQAFLQAGAASVVASYWRIADQETAQFMETFYKYLLVEHLTAAAALRRAQLDAAQAGTSHDWAAFTLYGWPDTAL
jgi:CHAT domain-containing protein/tetratricopeptide (TPR) repeat protein